MADSDYEEDPFEDPQVKRELAVHDVSILLRALSREFPDDGLKDSCEKLIMELEEKLKEGESNAG
jgi:hypothetical protein